MSMSMEPSNSGLYEEMDSGGEGGPNERETENDRTAATLMVSHGHGGSGNVPDSMRGSIPAPFRSSSTSSNYRQYTPPRSVPSMLSSSGKKNLSLF